MLPEIANQAADIAELCRRHGVARLEVFGSAARDADFDPATSDADFLVTFTAAAGNDLGTYLDLKEALETLLGRPVDMLERDAIEASRNSIRRRAILNSAQPLYG
ncbi:nucleotidyltransferase family protein [Thiohalocapsa sp. ML1]|uniref:nucleotidyltransferase family protein n=1 Tax=Thiohalocapsa sp. ML1 TaxID=1431688 RepID=UPI0007320E26|nr:nucleotidyltransferase domain-containing protein [Thiohalocapsa sp. ML1]